MKPLATSLLVFSLLAASPVARAAEPAPATQETAPALDTATLEAAIHKAMGWLNGKESDPGGIQYADYVVFCGTTVAKRYPQYAPLLDEYKQWIMAKDRFEPKLPYQSVCHVMGLDATEDREKAREMARQLLPMANDGKWLVSHHIGWYLYACVVAEDKALEEATLAHIENTILPQPDRHQYFTAYCLWKTFERTGDERYRETFLKLVSALKPHQSFYTTQATADGHAGMMLAVYARAFALTKDANDLAVAQDLARMLLNLQGEDGSWNGKSAYTIMPAEGLTLFLEQTR